MFGVSISSFSNFSKGKSQRKGYTKRQKGFKIETNLRKKSEL
jgi:hypothetical protein